MTAPKTEPQSQSGSIWMRKYGPLPLWAYGLILFGVVAAWRIYSDQKSGGSSSTSTTDTSASTTPPIVFQAYTTDIGTPSWSPPGGGRHSHPVAPPPPPPVSTAPPPPPTDVTGTTPKPTPTPTSPAPVGVMPTNPAASAPAAPSGVWVTVAKYTTVNPPWNSTISGIASHYGYGSNWSAVWNASQNAALVSRRKQPNLIQPGDQVWVPAK